MCVHVSMCVRDERGDTREERERERLNRLFRFQGKITLDLLSQLRGDPRDVFLVATSTSVCVCV